MSVGIYQTYTAIGPNLTSSFLGNGGTTPYAYSVNPGGAGGTINSASGLYTAPAVVNSDPNLLYDTVTVTDFLGNTASSQILVGSPLLLFCDIIQTFMGLANGRVYLFDQKIFQPQDNGLYIIVSVVSCKPFGNVNRYNQDGSDLNAYQYVQMLANLDINIISRGPAARDQKEMVILALKSNYAQQQQEKNSFYIGSISTGFRDLSKVDGAAIPYRYSISVNMQYSYSMSQAIGYFDSYDININTDPNHTDDEALLTNLNNGFNTNVRVDIDV